MKRAKWFIYLSLALVSICACLLFLSMAESQSNPVSDPPTYKEYYQIDPVTLLSDLRTGRKEVFVQLDSKPDDPGYSPESFSWSSEDYLMIAKAHHEYLTGEPVGTAGWMLYSFGAFDLTCRDNMQGFDSATIVFYKKEPDVFPVTYIEIKPDEGFIRSIYTQYPRIKYDNSIYELLYNPDWDYTATEVFQGTIGAEKALEIAEEANGREMRERYFNIGCAISVVYYENRWVVWYRWNADDLYYTVSFDIDATDGDYKIKSNKSRRCEREICPQE